MATDPIAVYTFTKNSAAQWTTNNPVLAQDEVGVERDTKFFKIGNGVLRWNQLPYVINAGHRGLIVFVSEDPDNLLEYGDDGGFKLLGEYFNGVEDYLKGKSSDPLVTSPTRRYHQTVYTIGRDVKDLYMQLANVLHILSTQPNAIGIDDASNTSATTTWSTSKITDYVLEQTLDVKADLLGNHAQAYDTLVQLSQHLASDPDFATSLATELAGTVKTNSIQTLSTAERAQARENIQAASRTEVGTAINVMELYNSTLGTTAGSLFVERDI